MANAPTSNFGAVTIYRDNPNALGAPGVNNDQTQGFSPGSRWYDATNKIVYMCANNDSGAAVWTRVLGGGINQTGTVAGGATTVAGGSAVTATGGALLLAGGAGSVGGATSIGGGTGSGGTNGNTILVNLPTSNPSVNRAIYGPTGAGALSISAG